MSSLKPDPVYALVDCNNFYCSCERVFNPALENKPMAVLSNNDGCIVARSNEIKALGIPMGAPMFQYKKILEKKKAIILSSNYQLYGDMSQRVMATLREFTPSMEVYSIDEAFLRLEEFKKLDIDKYSLEIRRTVKQWTGIPVSIGIAPNKTLAKVANHVAKKHTKNGVFNICKKITQNEILANFPVRDLWGVGRQLSKRLGEMGINTALKLRDVDIAWARKHFTVVGERLVRELRGMNCLDLEEVMAKKNITSSKSFGKLVTEKKELMSAVANYTTRACHKLRLQKSKAQGIYVYLRTNPFRRQDPQYNNGITYGFMEPSDDTTFIIQAARKCLGEIYSKGYKYHKAGIMLLDIVPATYKQMEMFDAEETQARSQLMKTIDTMNTTMGQDTIRFAAQGIEHPWARKCENRTPRYTTNWDELAKVI